MAVPYVVGLGYPYAQEIPIRRGPEPGLVRITPLGAGQEVGRSCILIEYRGKTVIVCSYPCTNAKNNNKL